MEYELLLQSTTNRIIARTLKLSENTVRNYVSKILDDFVIEIDKELIR